MLIFGKALDFINHIAAIDKIKKKDIFYLTLNAFVHSSGPVRAKILVLTFS